MSLFLTQGISFPKCLEGPRIGCCVASSSDGRVLSPTVTWKHTTQCHRHIRSFHCVEITEWESVLLSWSKKKQHINNCNLRALHRAKFIQSVFLRADSVLVLLQDCDRTPWQGRTPFLIWWNLQISTFGELCTERSRKAGIKGKV